MGFTVIEGTSPHSLNSSEIMEPLNNEEHGTYEFLNLTTPHYIFHVYDIAESSQQQLNTFSLTGLTVITNLKLFVLINITTMKIAELTVSLSVAHLHLLMLMMYLAIVFIGSLLLTPLNLIL